jgi:broad specificity phosphatase PhoE
MKLFRALALSFVFCTLISAPSTSAAGRQEASAPAVRAGVAAPHTVILVRHAEKLDQSKDPPLSDVGRKQADELAGLLERSKATYLFASNLKRTQETLAPLEKKLGKKARSGRATCPLAKVPGDPRGLDDRRRGALGRTVPELAAAPARRSAREAQGTGVIRGTADPRAAAVERAGLKL